MRRIVSVLIALAVILLETGPSSADQTSVTALLDEYSLGNFQSVVASLNDHTNFVDFLKHLKADAPAWIAAAGPDDQDRRILTAATVALEAARLDEWHEWKLVQRGFLPMDTVYWEPPPLLLAWGATLFRESGPPRPIERLWQQAAVAVAERSEDFEFLLGSPFEARANDKDEIEYLKPLLRRFPDEPRFLMAHAIALSWRTWPRPAVLPDGRKEAIEELSRLVHVDLVNAEAMVRLGEIRMREGDSAGALALFSHADQTTRDPDLVYVARFLSGQVAEREHRIPEAIAAFRGALEAVPGGQSASIALAAQLFLTNQPSEAGGLIATSFSKGRSVVDPWRIFADGDDRFWPDLIGRLRAEINR